MKKSAIANLAALLIALAPGVYLAIIWNEVPQTVPLHFDHEMKPDRFGNKSELWLVSGIIFAVSVFLFLLLKNIHRIDPKRKDLPSSGFSRLAFGMVVFMSTLSFLILLSATSGNNFMENLLFPFMGLLFAFLGNYMVNIKPNYFAGIRLPWTLSDDENWKRTHRLAGKLWFWGGMSLAIISLLIPYKFAAPLFIATMVILTLIPAIYSYRIFKGKV